MADPERIFSQLQEGLRGAMSAAATVALQRMKSPSFWGSTAGGRKYAALHTGRLYRLINITPASISGDDITVGIGDLAKLDALRPVSFQFNLRGKSYRSRESTSNFAYWRAIEFGVSPISGSHFVPSALSPWSRARGKGRASGMSFSQSGQARITGFVGHDSLGRRRFLGGEDQRRGKLLVPIAHASEYDDQRKAGLTRLPFRQGQKGTGRFSRFFRNIGVGFMVPGGQHPGVQPTYMFRRTSLYMNQQLRTKLESVVNAFINNVTRYFHSEFAGATRNAD